MIICHRYMYTLATATISKTTDLRMEESDIMGEIEFIFLAVAVQIRHQQPVHGVSNQLGEGLR